FSVFNALLLLVQHFVDPFLQDVLDSHVVIVKGFGFVKAAAADRGKRISEIPTFQSVLIELSTVQWALRKKETFGQSIPTLPSLFASRLLTRSQQEQQQQKKKGYLLIPTILISTSRSRIWKAAPFTARSTGSRTTHSTSRSRVCRAAGRRRGLCLLLSL